jgi:extradiol dioxygenase family protein
MDLKNVSLNLVNRDHYPLDYRDMKAPFHLAFPVKNLTVTKMFYHEVLGCPIGRMSDDWIDFDFFGNQISAHASVNTGQDSDTSFVDGKEVPLRHFGAVLSVEDWHKLAEKLKMSGAEFILEPQVRFENSVGEQHVMFVYDPSGNALEFKSYTNPKEIFAREKE